MSRSASFSVVITSTTVFVLCSSDPADHVIVEGVMGNKGHWRCCFANLWLTLERGMDITGIKHLKASR